MPVTLSYPGVYIEELSSGVRTITGVATSITAFIGSALRGPTDDDNPVRVQSFGEYERNFGGLWRNSTMSYAVQQFFQNGGTDALIVRVHNGANPATCLLAPDTNLIAANPGKWGEKLRVRVDHPSLTDDPSGKLFNLSVRDTATGVTERFLNLSTDTGNARYVTHVLEQESSLVRINPANLPTTRPAPTVDAAGDPFPPGSSLFTEDGKDGDAVTSDQISTGAGLEAAKKGLWALEKADLFNLLCIPPFTFDGDIDAKTRSDAAGYCEKRRAMYIVDPLNGWHTHSAVISALDGATWGLARSANAALYFPFAYCS